MTDADHADPALEPEAGSLALARELARTHPGAAASVREASTRPSRCCDWACRPRWRVRCARPTLRAALEREFAEPVGPVVHNDHSERSLMLTGPPPKFHGTWDILHARSRQTRGSRGG